MARGASAVFFVARTGSSRLPRKVLLPIEGRALILHHFDRMKLAQLPERLVLCTTDSPADDELAAVAEEYGIDVFRGPEMDVPQRLLQACDKFGVETFILCETDEHYTDPAHIDALLEYVEKNGGDWVHIEGNPIGAWARAISRNAMATLCAERTTEGLDGWGYFFEKQPERFQLGNFSVLDPETQKFSEDVRLTIDYPEDFELAEALYARLYKDGQPLRLNAVIDALKAEPALININLHRQDQYWERLQAQSQGLADGSTPIRSE
ncbi:cytidylyltransferase domain-containing protein [Fimbriimonas ginsengisoli]|uniref:Spore coat polysaccharide biosynthesis protein F n=1 Tax=Fimbriimonas ginsengisoli Gsoil 348 TaxID=661478 RepID=A0A068NTG9_FIMGI|nr:NTP transferase domain-containing protein [Fimbriimonas ginsengisoli]AIE86632.1 Spore coat polysaccharide biosynthesis protein F [Fimbriimonas ginsengisoli Gsoil 348]